MGTDSGGSNGVVKEVSSTISTIVISTEKGPRCVGRELGYQRG